MLRDIYLTRLFSIPTVGKTLSAKYIVAIQAQLAQLGYRVIHPELLTDNILLEFPQIIETLKKMKGGDVKYVPLFSTFPQIPDDNEYFCKRLVGYLADCLGVKLYLFDTDEFGADPVTQFQSLDIYNRALELQKSKSIDSHIVFTDLHVVYDPEYKLAKDYLKSCLYAKSEVKQFLHEEIKYLLDKFGDIVDPNKIVNKENKSLYWQYAWKNNKPLGLSTATDCLRLFASLTESDVSLTKPIKFPKLNRVQRRTILSALEKDQSLEDNLAKYSGLWKSINKMLHIGEYANVFPKTNKLFNKLLNDKLTTFNSRVEKAIAKEDMYGALRLLKDRPSIYVRKLQEIMNKIGAPQQIDLSNVPTKTLLVALSHFRNVNRPLLGIINKKGNLLVKENPYAGKFYNWAVEEVIDMLQKAIIVNLQKKSDMGRVWIDPELAYYKVPFKQRNAVDGLKTFGRGSQISVDMSKTIRMFMYWQQNSERTDYDLSALMLDDNFNIDGHVSWTNLRDGSIIHSGDIQSAPYGAAEFIDIEPSKINTRYIGIQIYKYTGENFNETKRSYVGWMERVDRSLPFDIKTVVNKMNVCGNQDVYVPFVLDRKTSRIIYLDLFLKNRNTHATVEGCVNNLSNMIKQIVTSDATPTIYDLASLNIMAGRGKISKREYADLTIGVDGCDINAWENEKILSELL